MLGCMFTTILLYLCPTVTADRAIASRWKVSFTKQAICPGNASLTGLSKIAGAQDVGTCFVACAANANCSVLHRTGGGVCYLGNLNQLTDHFTLNKSCVSHVKTIALKLAVFLDFRQGYRNLVRPGTFDATPHGTVTRDANGAHFPGNKTSYIEVDTRNGSLVSEYLNQTQSFSFFAKVIRQTYQRVNYHSFTDCFGGENAGDLRENNGRVVLRQRFIDKPAPQDTEFARSVKADLDVNNTLQTVSVGAAISNGTADGFYLNGASLDMRDKKNWTSSHSPRCLLLGYGNSNKGLNGRMTCYVIAKAALTPEEFQQLDEMCKCKTE